MRVAIIGAGVIGTAWAVAFARAGAHVRVCDASAAVARDSRRRIARILRELDRFFPAANAADGVARVTVVEDIAGAVSDVDYVQESVAEKVQIKRKVLQAIAQSSGKAIIGSSTSAIPPRELFAAVSGRERCLVAHPINPPYLIPLVELVSSPWTSAASVKTASRLLRAGGMSPVVLRRPIEGFVANRLQAAVINEAMYLVGAGVIDPLALDQCMTDGLGLRWAFAGPFACMDGNAAGGVGEYMKKFGSAYQAIGRDLGVMRRWRAAAMLEVERARRRRVPAAQLQSRRRQRDRLIVAVRNAQSSLRKRIPTVRGRLVP